MSLIIPKDDTTPILPENCNFHSEYHTMSVKRRGSFEYTTEYSEESDYIPTELIINHDFGYIPFFMCFSTPYSQSVEQFEAKYVMLDYSYRCATPKIFEQLVASVDKSNIYIKGKIWDATNEFSIVHTYKIDFILFMEEAQS